MIHHIVMWSLKPEARGADRASNAIKMKSLLESMAGKVPGMTRLSVGLATPGLEANADVVLVTEFVDEAALAAYQNHTDHVAMKDFIGAIRETRHVIDYRAP